MIGALASLIEIERRQQRAMLTRAALCALLVGAASVALLGLSGWFITAAALARAAGPIAVQAFNYMLPSATIRFLAIMRTGARYGERLTSHAAALSALARLRAKLFRAVAAMPAVRALEFSLGDLSARMTQDIDVIEAQFVRQSAPWYALGSVLSGSALIALASWPAVLATLASVGLLLIAARLVARQTEDHGRAVQTAGSDLKDLFGTLASAAPELRCYGLEGWAEDRMAEQGERLGSAQRAHSFALAWFEWLQAGATGIATVAVLLLSAPSGMAIAALATLAAAMTMDGLAPMLRDLAARGTVLEAESRLDAVLNEATFGVTLPQRNAVQATALTIDGQLFASDSRVAVVGGFGIRKDEPVEALIGLRSVAPARVSIGGVDLVNIPSDDLRSFFAWAPQDAGLLAGTVRENLLLARGDADDAELWAVLHDAAIAERIATLPGGLDGWIGENGTRLSGGERRRLSLARAYLAPTPWLLLDEPTEGLDRETERLVVDRLERRLDATGQGLILVSHRPVPRELCDRIVPIPPADTLAQRDLAA